MREHGVLRRLLLTYDEISRCAATEGPPLAALATASRLIRHFIEDYHEKLEEAYIFPAFEKAGRLTALTAVLRVQHQAGRRITAQLQGLAAGGAPPVGDVAEAQASSEVGALVAQFLRMYRPHAAREDTVLFPRFPGVVGQARYGEFGEAFEDRERELFGREGFEGIVGQVQALEKQLGIYDLAQFTPK